jgi:hypothetical protein
MTKCDACIVIQLPGAKNYEDSNWCKNCQIWKPKDQVFCECCKQRMRYSPRRNTKFLN